MSEIRATTISAVNGTDPVTLTKQSAAKVFNSYDGDSGGSITTSFNVSSLTDNATGHFTSNFTNSMSSSSFNVVTSANDIDASNSLYSLDPHTYASGNVQCDSWKQSSGVTTEIDINHNHLAVFGDLA